MIQVDEADAPGSDHAECSIKVFLSSDGTSSRTFGTFRRRHLIVAHRGTLGRPGITQVVQICSVNPCTPRLFLQNCGTVGIPKKDGIEIPWSGNAI